MHSAEFLIFNFEIILKFSNVSKLNHSKLFQNSKFEIQNSVPRTVALPHSEIPGSKLAHQLPEAYRRSLRPSSLTRVKASTIRHELPNFNFEKSKPGILPLYRNLSRLSKEADNSQQLAIANYFNLLFEIKIFSFLPRCDVP
jgi:hypothetical protein